MNADLRPYPEYSAPTVEWLGRIPAHWSCLPHRTLFREIKDQGHIDEQLLSVTISRGLIRQSDLLAESSLKDSSNLDKSKYKLVVPGDIAYNKMRAWQGAVGVSRHRGIVSPAYIVVRLRNSNNPYFFHYLFRTPAFTTEAERWSYGITSDQWSLRSEHFKMIYSCVPPIPEQDAIVAFIRQFDRKVQRLIRNRRRLIEVLNEQKQAIINRAVTRGLDPNVSLKPSGIDWLGGIPEHWYLVRLKYLLKRGLANGLFKTKDQYGSGTLLINVFDIYQEDHIIKDHLLERVAISDSEQQQYEVHAGDIFFVRSSIKLEGTGRSSTIEKLLEPAVFECHLVCARPNNERVNSRYLLHYLNSHPVAQHIVSCANRVTIATVPQHVLSNLLIALPPKEEQNMIVEALNEDLYSIDKAREKALQDIELIHEYRTRLIADVVTGKIDVRDLALTLGDEEAEIELEDMDEVIGEDDILEDREHDLVKEAAGADE